MLVRVGYGWLHVLVMVVIPFAALFVLWGVGFRLVRMPYRDWRPASRQRSTVWPIPGTGYQVLQADLDRYTPVASERTIASSWLLKSAPSSSTRPGRRWPSSAVTPRIRSLRLASARIRAVVADGIGGSSAPARARLRVVSGR